MLASTGMTAVPTRLETALQSDRSAVVVLLFALPGVCWAWIVAMARDMSGSMAGASRWMMTPSWDSQHLFLLWAMWAVMMTGMMLPSATPMLLVYGAAVRRRAAGQDRHLIYALAAGYLTVWALFSVLTTVLQRWLAEWLLVSPMMTLTSPATGGVVLILAGIYQWTPLKRVCLTVCQSPLGFMMGHWRDGAPGAYRMGLEHGFHCLGCCWALMLLLFVGGVMNLWVILALTLFVAFEKVGLFGRYGNQVSGAALLAVGVLMLVR